MRAGIEDTSYQALNLANQIRLLGDAPNTPWKRPPPEDGRQKERRCLRMSDFIYFILGTTLGGMFGVAAMCVLQINRLSEEKGDADAETKRTDTVPTDRGRS